MKRKVALLIFLCIATAFASFVGTTDVSADTITPTPPWKIILDNGNRIFYWTPEGQENATQLKSGLYYNTKPPTNIYYVESSLNRADSFLREGFTVFSSDGIYFALFPWTSQGVNAEGYSARNLSGQAINFYENGLLIRSYCAGDFLKDVTKAMFSVTHVMWENSGLRKFDATHNVLSILTLDNLVYNFDIATGAILSETELEAILHGPAIPPAPQLDNISTTDGWPLPNLVLIGGITIIALLIILAIVLRSKNA